MNTFMYQNPLTAKQLRVVTDELGYEVVGPISKGLACGDLGRLPSPSREGLADVAGSGIGAMTEWSDIVDLVVERYALVER